MSSSWGSEKAMTKSDLAGHIARKAGVTKKTAGDILDALADVACSETRSKGQFAIPGLGKFVTGMRKARMGRNPSTGQSIHIPEKRVVKFRISKSAKDKMT